MNIEWEKLGFDDQLAVVCFSHLRWNSVFQRPQHLMTRFAAVRDVLFVEEAVRIPEGAPSFELRVNEDAVQVVRPLVPVDPTSFEGLEMQRRI